MGFELVAVIAVFLGLVVVIVRLLKVGCRLVMYVVYFTVLAVAAALLYSVLQRASIMEGIGR